MKKRREKLIASSVAIVIILFAGILTYTSQKNVLLSPNENPCYWENISGSSVKMAEHNELMHWIYPGYDLGIEDRILCYNGRWYVAYTRDKADISGHKQSSTNPNGYLVKQDGEKIGEWVVADGIWKKIIKSSLEISRLSPSNYQIVDSLNQGDKYYTDRNYTITSNLPSFLDGCSVIKTSNSNKKKVSFYVNKPVKVYLGWDMKEKFSESAGRGFILNNIINVTDSSASNDGYLKLINLKNFDKKVTISKKQKGSNYIIFVCPSQLDNSPDAIRFTNININNEIIINGDKFDVEWVELKNIKFYLLGISKIDEGGNVIKTIVGKTLPASPSYEIDFTKEPFLNEGNGRYRFNLAAVTSEKNYYYNFTFVRKQDNSVANKIIIKKSSNGMYDFYDSVSGEIFYPRGSVLIYLKHLTPTEPRYTWWRFPEGDWESTLNPVYYNISFVENELSEMSADGYNVVKVYVGGDAMALINSKERLDSKSIDVLVDFLSRAKAHGIYVYLVGGYIPKSYNDIIDKSSQPANVEGFNNYFMHQGVMNAQVMFVDDVINSVRKKDASLINSIFAFDIVAEGFFNADTPNIYYNDSTATKPWSLQKGKVIPANGKTYDLSKPNERKALADDSVKYWINNVAGRIKANVSDVLLTESILTPQATDFFYNGVCASYTGLNVKGCSRESFNPKFFAQSSYIDFITIHLYPVRKLAANGNAYYNIKEDLGSAGIVEGGKFKDGSSLNKPLFMGEYGADTKFFKNATSAKDFIINQEINSCKYGFRGWIVFTWNSGIGQNDLGFWSVKKINQLGENMLAPFLKTNPCSN